MIKLVAFDFDGTIAETVEQCLLAFDEVFKKMSGAQAPGREELFQQFGRNEKGIFRRYLGPRGEEAFAEFCRLHEKFHQTMCRAPFPGIKESLLALKSRGVKLTLLTGRCRETAEISLKALELEGFFDACWYGSAETTSKALQMREMLELFHLHPGEAVYVGDAVSDAKSSAEAGLVCLSAAWARSARRSDLDAVNRGLVFDSVASLQKWLEARI